MLALRCDGSRDAGRRTWERRSVIGWEYLILSLPAFEEAKSTQGHSAGVDVLDREGALGWEAVGMSVLADASVAVLLKRRSADDHDARRGRPSRSTD